MRSEKSCGAVIFRRSSEVKYLLLEYAAGHWDFAKGHAEKGETEEATVRREVKEETGIADLRFEKGFNEHIAYLFKEGSSMVLKRVGYLLAETKTVGVKLSPEHKGYRWLAYRRAVEMATYQTAKDLLKKAHDFLEKREVHEKP